MPFEFLQRLAEVAQALVAQVGSFGYIIGHSLKAGMAKGSHEPDCPPPGAQTYWTGVMVGGNGGVVGTVVGGGGVGVQRSSPTFGLLTP